MTLFATTRLNTSHHSWLKWRRHFAQNNVLSFFLGVRQKKETPQKNSIMYGLYGREDNKFEGLVPVEVESLRGGSERVRRRVKLVGDATGFLPWSRNLQRFCIRTLGKHATKKRFLALGLACGLACGILVFVVVAHERHRTADDERVFSLAWRDVIPELEPVYTALQHCARHVRQEFDDLQVQQLFACDASPQDGPFGAKCVEEAKRHLRAVAQPSGEGLSWYEQNEKERAERWPRGRPRCNRAQGFPRAEVRWILSLPI